LKQTSTSNVDEVDNTENGAEVDDLSHDQNNDALNQDISQFLTTIHQDDGHSGLKDHC